MDYSEWLSPHDSTANTLQIGSFAVYLWRFGMNQLDHGNSYATICGKVSAVKWFHRNHLGYNPAFDARHTILMRGIRRMSDPVSKQMPLTARLLLIIHSEVDLGNPRGQLMWGGLLLGYFFLLRRSEYLHIDGKRHGYILKLGDIALMNKKLRACRPRKAQVVRILLKGAKNNQFGREEFRFQHKSGHKILCPVKAARWVLKGAQALGTVEGAPALSTGQNTGISSKEISRLIKRAARVEGLDADRFSTHSVRIGGATALLNAGADRLVIKLLGRWLSNTFEDYPVLTAEGTANLSSLMC